MNRLETRFAAMLVKSIIIGLVLGSFMYSIGVTVSATFAALPVTTTETALLIVGAVAPVAIGISEYMTATNPTRRFVAHVVKGISIGLVLGSFMYLIGVVIVGAFTVLATPTFETALLIIGLGAPVAIEISEYMHAAAKIAGPKPEAQT